MINTVRSAQSAESEFSVRALSFESLRLAAGAFCAAMGVLMLVAPHQFSWPAFEWLQNQLTGWGIGFLVAGVGLFAVVTLAPGFRLVVLAHLWAGGLLLVLAAGFVRAGAWSETPPYLVLGLGTAVAPLLARSASRRRWLHGEAFALFVGLGALLSGLIMLASPLGFAAPRYDLARPFLSWFGLAFVVSAALLCLSQTTRLIPPSIGRFVPVMLGSVFLLFGAMISIPLHDWTGGIFHGGFGALLVLLSMLRPWLRRFDPHSLRSRLALVLAAAVAVPLVVLVAVFAHNQESRAVAEQLGRQQAVANAVAQNMSDYITLHQSAVMLLAAQPGLLTMSPGQQHDLLKSARAAYPDVVAFGTAAANGDSIARSDEFVGTSWINDIVFLKVRGTNLPALGIRMSPVIHRPVFTLAIPILDADHNFMGMVSASLESSRLGYLLSRTDFGQDAVAYLVDSTGHIIAHPDVDLVASFADVSSNASVAAFLSNPAASGSLRVAGPRGGVLASYARLPGLGWGAVVEQPAADGLEPIQTRLDLLFGGLLVVVGLAAAFGVVAAGWLSRPLATLAVAVDRLATGDSSAPLPKAGLTEIVRLAATFSHLRKQLVARTAERELADEALKHQALHDALTGLPNRVLFTDRLEHALARTDRQTDSVAVLFLDLNRFKGINDSLGHDQGDTVLVTIAERLRACIRGADTAARFGGDEFTLLLEGNNGLVGAIGVAERIVVELAHPIPLKGTNVVVSASIGIAMRGPVSSAAQLLREADLAMYRAKRSGPDDAFAMFDPELDSKPPYQPYRALVVGAAR